MSPTDRFVSCFEEGETNLFRGMRRCEDRYAQQLDRIVMPDHIHGLIGITTESPFYSGHNSPDRSAVDSSRRDESTAMVDGGNDNDFRLHAHSLGAVMCQYKSVCTKRIRRGEARFRMAIPVLRPDCSESSRISGDPEVHSTSSRGMIRPVPPTVGPSTLTAASRPPSPWRYAHASRAGTSSPPPRADA